jgi:hypothetical protein
MGKTEIFKKVDLCLKEDTYAIWKNLLCPATVKSISWFQFYCVINYEYLLISLTFLSEVSIYNSLQQLISKPLFIIMCSSSFQEQLLAITCNISFQERIFVTVYNHSLQDRGFTIICNYSFQEDIYHYLHDNFLLYQPFMMTVVTMNVRACEGLTVCRCV